MSEPEIVEATDPDEAFALLGNETRLDIVRALWAAGDHEATFSELREAVGMRDSGQFNYHLDKLVGRFVEPVEEGDGYRLTHAGRQVHGAVLSGAYTKEGAVDPVSLDEPCGACGGDRTFRYDGQQVAVKCEGCGVGTFFGVPPGAFAGYDPGEWPAVTERYVRNTFRQTNEGFCPYCEGRVRSRVAGEIATRESDEEPPEPYRDFPSVRYTCERCGEEFACDLGTALADHPAVVSFYRDHGIDAREAPLDEFRAIDPDDAWVDERHPLEASVRYTADVEALTLTVDGNLEVLEEARTDG